jgi:phosphatidylglycerophosphate synthase
VPANAVTAASVVYGGASGMALAGGHFGIGAWLAASSALCDALDGMVARKSGTASPAGEALDSSVDRYSEFFFLTGLALHFRDSAWMLAVVLLALQGAFMVSFAETKAESLRVVVSPGWMRRPDRATLLIAGATLSALGAGLHAARWVVLAPVLAALLIDGLGANAAAARRLLRILAQLKGGSTARGAAAAGEAEEARGEPPPVSIIPAPAVVRPLPSARMLATERYHLSHR